MITFECCQCQEEFTEDSPFMWGELYPYDQGEPSCKKCVDTYNGPSDELLEVLRWSNFK